MLGPWSRRLSSPNPTLSPREESELKHREEALAGKEEGEGQGVTTWGQSIQLVLGQGSSGDRGLFGSPPVPYCLLTSLLHRGFGSPALTVVVCTSAHDRVTEAPHPQLGSLAPTRPGATHTLAPTTPVGCAVLVQLGQSLFIGTVFHENINLNWHLYKSPAMVGREGTVVVRCP